MENTMCNDLEAARLNRERVKERYGNRFYEQQANSVAQWQWGEPAPKEVILGELPYAGKVGREQKEDV